MFRSTQESGKGNNYLALWDAIIRAMPVSHLEPSCVLSASLSPHSGKGWVEQWFPRGGEGVEGGPRLQQRDPLILPGPLPPPRLLGCACLPPVRISMSQESCHLRGSVTHVKGREARKGAETSVWRGTVANLGNWYYDGALGVVCTHCSPFLLSSPTKWKVQADDDKTKTNHD